MRSPRFSSARAVRCARVRFTPLSRSCYGERVPFSSVNQALSTHANGDGGRFRRVRYGTDAIAGR